MALIIKVPPIPTKAIIIPAKLGPMTRAAFIVITDNAVADGNSSFPTMSTLKAWRAGISIAFAHPSNKAIIIICQMETRLVIVSPPNAKAHNIAVVWVIKRILRLEKRSTITPPCSDKNKDGSVAAAPIIPTKSGEPVSFQTSHPCATTWSQVPVLEIIRLIK